MTIPAVEGGALGFSRRVLIRRRTDRIAEFFRRANEARA